MAISWNGWYWHLGLASFIAMGGAIASGNCAHAQVTPDSTLGAESSVVTPTNVNGIPSEQIDGGATRGANLFHSFEQFSVPTGGEAFFNNAANIQNIIGRVTGASISNIDGLLRGNGAANLFLINPNGIIFGPNARLDVGGSFVGSTASSLNFADGSFFSATAPQATPLLTVSVPIGLQYGGTSGGIQVRESNLRVRTGQTLALMGGDVSVSGGESGVLEALGGRIELGGLAGAGMVDIEGQQSEGAFRLTSLRFPDSVERADVLLTNLAYVDVSASGGGSIAINARNIDISGESSLRGGLETNLGFPGAQAGDIDLSAIGTINVANADIFNNVRTGSVGQGGNINVTTGSLAVRNGELGANTLGQGNAGRVNINARDTVFFDGESAAFNQVASQAVGNSGGINITTGSLSVTNGAQLTASTYGQGNAGSVNINARDTVSFDGVSSDGFSSAVRSVVEESGAVGNGGGINIITGSLSVTNGAQLSASTYGQGNAGSVNINARDTVSFDGVNSNGLSSGAFSQVASQAVGNGGTINVTTGLLSVTNSAFLTAYSQGSGAAGTIEVAADSIRLNNQAVLTSDTGAGEGNIFLRSQDLVLRRGSNITTNAISTASGGNINIDSDVIAALENSDISANSANSFGGRVIIDAQGIFGTEFRNQRTPESDITASSRLGPQFSGTVEINNPDVDPTQGLVELPAELVDASNQIAATGCPEAVWRGKSKFIITGRGGLPPNPYEPLRGDNTLTNWSTLEEPDGENRSSTAPSTNPTKDSAPTTIVEANGWVKGPNGEVTLVATAPTANIDIPWLPESSCNAPEPES